MIMFTIMIMIMIMIMIVVVVVVVVIIIIIIIMFASRQMCSVSIAKYDEETSIEWMGVVGAGAYHY